MNATDPMSNSAAGRRPADAEDGAIPYVLEITGGRRLQGRVRVEGSTAALAHFELARRDQCEHTMQGRKHEHLQLLCARFETRGLPVETALLRDHLTVLERQRVPAYADPSRTEIRNLLAAHGFRRAEPLKNAPAGLYPMVREPSGPGP